MPAHLRPLTRCEYQRCGKPATQELFNTWNAPSGRYCDRHAEVALANWKALDDVRPNPTA